jgi:chaperonin cofactor prefoldin
MNGVDPGPDDFLNALKFQLEALKQKKQKIAARIENIGAELQGLQNAAQNDPCLPLSPEYKEKIEQLKIQQKDAKDISEYIDWQIQKINQRISGSSNSARPDATSGAKIKAAAKKLQGKDGKKGVQGIKGADASATTGQSKVCKK